MRLLFFVGMLLTMHAPWQVFAQNFRIQIHIQGCTEKQLYLGYYLGDKQYLLDTADAMPPGQFVFQGDSLLKPGVYLVVLPSSKDYLQILITAQDQTFTLQTKQQQLSAVQRIEGSEENKHFYEYLQDLNRYSAKANKYSALQKDSTASEKAKKQGLIRLNQLNEAVLRFQKAWVQKHPETFVATLIKANRKLEIPESLQRLPAAQKELQTWHWMRQHYFDDLPLGDPRLLRTPFLFERVNQFVYQLSPQHPDSICTSIDTVLSKMVASPETFQYYLIHFLNHAAGSPYVGMDAVYVHLVEQYYAQGKVPWINAEQLERIKAKANKLKPLLIGKPAPDILLERNGQRIQLSQIKSPFTVLFFWRYDCGHCTESLPPLKSFYEKFQNKGITLVAICVKPSSEQAKCAQYLQEQNMPNWFNATDPSGRYFQWYNLETTPQIYILDEQKTILSKQIPADQLEMIMDKIIQQKKSN